MVKTILWNHLPTFFYIFCILGTKSHIPSVGGGKEGWDNFPNFTLFVLKRLPLASFVSQSQFIKIYVFLILTVTSMNNVTGTILARFCNIFFFMILSNSCLTNKYLVNPLQTEGQKLISGGGSFEGQNWLRRGKNSNKKPC